MAARSAASWKTKLRKTLFSSNVFPFLIIFTAIGVLFVLFRMKSVELDYKEMGLNKEIEKNILDGKDLKAKKARMLSVGNLRRMAQRYQLARPKQNQIIVIPK